MSLRGRIWKLISSGVVFTLNVMSGFIPSLEYLDILGYPLVLILFPVFRNFWCSWLIFTYSFLEYPLKLIDIFGMNPVRLSCACVA